MVSSPVSRRRIAVRALVAALVLLAVFATQAQARSYFRNIATGQNGTGATTLTVNVPSGTVAGDVIIAGIVTAGTPFIGGMNADFYQAAAGATPGQTFSFSGNAGFVAVQIALRASATSLAFGTAPALPTLSPVTLNGQSQTVNTTMTDFDVD